MALLTPKQQEMLKTIAKYGVIRNSYGLCMARMPNRYNRDELIAVRLDAKRFESLLKRDLLEVADIEITNLDCYIMVYRLSQRGEKFLKAYGLSRKE